MIYYRRKKLCNQDFERHRHLKSCWYWYTFWKISKKWCRCSKPVIDICNLSMSLNKFANVFKLAKVKSIFKKGQKNNLLNYWPISLLAILLTVIENVVHEQTTKFLNDKNVLCKYQSGLRNTHSTDLFVSFPNNKILKGFDSGVYTDMILTDLQKTCDTIKIWYHKILLDKLLPIGFSKNTVSWYQSY